MSREQTSDRADGDFASDGLDQSSGLPMRRKQVTQQGWRWDALLQVVGDHPSEAPLEVVFVGEEIEGDEVARYGLPLDRDGIEALSASLGGPDAGTLQALVFGREVVADEADGPVDAETGEPVPDYLADPMALFPRFDDWGFEVYVRERGRDEDGTREVRVLAEHSERETVVATVESRGRAYCEAALEIVRSSSDAGAKGDRDP